MTFAFAPNEMGNQKRVLSRERIGSDFHFN